MVNGTLYVLRDGNPGECCPTTCYPGARCGSTFANGGMMAPGNV